MDLRTMVHSIDNVRKAMPEYGSDTPYYYVHIVFDLYCRIVMSC